MKDRDVERIADRLNDPPDPPDRWYLWEAADVHYDEKEGVIDVNGEECKLETLDCGVLGAIAARCEFIMQSRRG